MVRATSSHLGTRGSKERGADTANTDEAIEAEDTAEFVYITGCDGTGKTTQARLMLDYYRGQGFAPRHLWLRFPFFLTLPLLVYARLRGFSWYETRGEIRQGYWDFRGSWLLRTILPWVLLVDTTVAAVFRVHLPLARGHKIVCERFVYDILVDLSLALGDPELHLKLPGRLFLKLLPRTMQSIILYLDPATLRARRSDLEIDRHLEARLAGFQRLAQDLDLPLLSSHMSIERINQEIIGMVQGERA